MNELFDDNQETAAPEAPRYFDPGVYPLLENAEYHGAQGISNSGLTIIGTQSPAHYYGKRLDPNRPPEERKSGQEDGTIAHCAILEPETFEERFVTSSEKMHRGTKVWKEFAAEAEANGMTAIQPDQRDMAWRMHESVRKIDDVRMALDQRGYAEASAFWRDEETGELCKCRPDYAAQFDAGDLLLDVKTYSSADPWEFAKQIARKYYYQQDAMYSEGWEIATLRKVLGFIFIAVETEYPHVATAVTLGPDDKAIGHNTFRYNLDTYAECRRTGIWPAYSQAIEEVSLPRHITG